jgi:hypothetical protein
MRWPPFGYKAGNPWISVLAGVVLGAVFAALVRAEAAWRVALAAVLFALTGWALLQYFRLPLVQPLVTEKGFTPEWYALSSPSTARGRLLALRGGREPAQSDLDAWRERMRQIREGD